MKAADPPRRVICNNNKARFNYAITQTLEVGVALQGTEVKALRCGRATLGESYVGLEGGELFLINAHIPIYEKGNRNNHAPRRLRKLLAHDAEIRRFSKDVAQAGMTIVPLSLYFNKRGRVKLQIALGKGKKLYDKRETMKQRDWNREKQRLLRFKR